MTVYRVRVPNGNVPPSYYFSLKVAQSKLKYLRGMYVNVTLAKGTYSNGKFSNWENINQVTSNEQNSEHDKNGTHTAS